MKADKTFFYLMMVVALVHGSTGCSSESDEVSQNGMLKSFAKTGCKPQIETRTADVSGLYDAESFSYEATKDGSLLLCHNNAIFSCETDIKVKVSVSDGVISVIEYYSPATNCICAYDLTMEIGPLQVGPYTVVVYRDFDINIGKTSPQAEYIRFPINYTEELKGEYIVTKME